jgi:hypothetical protein
MPHHHGVKNPPCPPFSKGGSKSPFEKGELGGFEFFTVKPVATFQADVEACPTIK